MITPSLTIPVAAVATAATIVYIGLGFVPRPSRAGVLWSAGFALAMVASYVYVTSDTVDTPAAAQLRALGSGLLLGAMAFMWSGIRAFRGARALVGVSIAYVVVSPVVLLVASPTPYYAATFRGLFVVTAVLAALTVIELLRLGKIVRDEVFPMLAVSGLFVVLAAILVANGILVLVGVTAYDSSLAFVRTVNLVSATVYILCVLVTVLLLTVRSQANTASVTLGRFELQARTRLRRAQAADDQWWSVLDVRLDDADDIRAAAGTAAFEEATASFARAVDAVLPPDADIEQLSPTRFIALVPRAQGSVREIIRDLLTRVAELGDESTLPVRLSASVGWSQVSAAGYDLDDLLAAADQAAQRAHAAGGDRWERAREMV